MDGYSHTLDFERFAARRAQPLHRHLKNLYRKKRRLSILEHKAQRRTAIVPRRNGSKKLECNG
jgi:hypothetical protein